jgi:hypothetical protein
MHVRFPLAALSLAAVAASVVAAEEKPLAPKTPAPKAAKPVAAAAETVAPRTLEHALLLLQRRRVDVDFKDLPLDEVVAFVGKIARVNTMVSAQFQAKAAGSLPLLTLRLRNVTLRQLAETVAKTTGSRMVLRDGILQFTTPEDARGTPVLRVFSIADLTFRIRNFPGPDIRLHTGDVRYVQEEETDQATPFDDPQTVVDLLRKFTGEGTWDDEEVSISADDRRIVVKQYPEVLREISRFLAVMRAAK